MIKYSEVIRNILGTLWYCVNR